MEAAHHRKIELQAPEDFAYLVDNVRRAAADSVSAAFPPVVSYDDDDDAASSGAGDKKGAGKKNKKKRVDEDDDLHARVEVLVNEVRSKRALEREERQSLHMDPPLLTLRPCRLAVHPPGFCARRAQPDDQRPARGSRAFLGGRE